MCRFFNSMRFHAAVIALFQPFVRGPLQRVRLQTFTSNGSAMCAFNSSIDQLKRLVITYRRTFEYQAQDTVSGAAGSLFLASLLCQLGPSQERNDVAERRHYFSICITGLLNLLPRIPVMATTIFGLLAVGLSTETITAAYAKTVMARISEQTGQQYSPNAETGSPFVVDFELALIDRLSATADSAAAKLGHIVLLHGSKPQSMVATVDQEAGPI